MQCVLVELCFRQQCTHAQRTARILLTKKLVLSHRIFQTLLILEVASLLGKQFRCGIDRCGRILTARILVIDVAESIESAGVVFACAPVRRNRLKRIPALRGLLPRRQRRGMPGT